MYRYKQKTNKTNTRKKINIIVISVISISVLICFGYYYKSSEKNTTTPIDNETINYEPARPAEKKEAEENKDALVNRQEVEKTDTSTTTNKKQVKPSITNTSGSVNAYVSGIFEEGGTCTAVFNNDAITNTKTSTGFRNVSYTQCAPINIESGFLSAGTWTVTVKYSSEKSEGTSDIQTIEVK